MELLEKNIGLYEKMRDLAMQQQSSLEEDRMDAFLHLARERDRLRFQIERNEKKLSLASGYRNGSCKEMILRKEKIIRSLQKVDQKNKESILVKRENLLTQIRDLRKGQKALKGYGTKAAKDARFFDGRG